MGQTCLGLCVVVRFDAFADGCRGLGLVVVEYLDY
jgi:hypothetical protein